jgi:hypothetical protein
MTQTNAISTIGFSILQAYTALEHRIRTEVLSIFSEETEEAAEYLPALVAYYSEFSKLSMENLECEWEDFFFSESFLSSFKQEGDVTELPIQQHYLQKALNTRRLKIIHSIHKVLNLLREAQKEREPLKVISSPKKSIKGMTSMPAHSIRWIPRIV